MIKYLVIPDWVVSKTDGQFHYINADKLIKLYNVDRRECKIIGESKPECRSRIYESRLLDQYKDLIKLAPRYDGNYKI